MRASSAHTRARKSSGLGPFDLVTGVYVLPYATTKEHLFAMCKSIYNALKPGGRFATMPANPGLFWKNRDYYAKYRIRLFLKGRTRNPATEGR